MTNDEKRKIQELRASGYGYGKISETIGIPLNTVKAYCRRNGLGGAVVQETAEANVEIRYCKCCNAVIQQLTGRKEKKFCSDRCRNKWWNSHLDQVDRRANYECTCQNCGIKFISYGRKERKYCSRSCYLDSRFGGGSK